MTEVQAPLRAAAEWGPPQSSNLDANDLMTESAAPANTSAAMQQQQAPLPSQGAVLVRPKPVRVPPHLVRPVPVRPVPVKPQRAALPAISQQDAAQFYAQAHAQGVPAQAVHQAVVASHEWHRKWTHQETVGHFIEEKESDTSNDSSPQLQLPLKLPEHYAFDRMAGAKNPSPEQEDPMEVPQQQQQRKRHLIPDEDEESETERDEEETDSQEEGEEDLLQPLKRRLERTSLPAGRQSAMAAPIVPLAVRPVPQRPVLPQLVRPVALRIAAAADQIVDLPHDIPRGFRTQQLSVSPLTVPSGCGSSRKSRNSRSQRSASAYAQHQPQYPHQPPSTAQHAYAQQQSHWIPEHDDDEQALLLQEGVTVPAEISHPARSPVWSRPVRHARDGLLHALAISGGQVESEAFTASLGLLRQAYANAGLDTCLPESAMSEGTWLTLTKPTFFACLGENDNGDPMYQLGRMAFDMFSPTTTVCSLQGNFNVVERVSHVDELASIPKSLQEEVAAGTSVLRTYNIATAFTIEPSLAAYPNAPNKDVHRPIRGIMTTQGYCLADPEEPNRHSVWITGGKIEPNDNALDQQDWHRLFSRHPPKHSMTEKAKLLAVQLLMGATLPQSVDAQTGAMEYQFTRPLGGHGFAYVDTLYVDQTLRIVQGHRGTIFVFLRQSPS